MPNFSYNNPKLQEFLKFCIVGGLCTAIDAIVYYATYRIVGYKIALILGFTLSLIVNYILNIKWSFQSKLSVKNALGLIGANCFNIFVVRMSLMWLFTSFYGLDEGIAFVPTLVISVFTNFIIVRSLVRERQ